MRELVDAFFDERSVAQHHIASYNDFIDHWIQRVVDNIAVGDDDEVPDGTIQTDVEGYKIRLGQIRVGRPQRKEADGSTDYLTPMEARLRDMTYDAPVFQEFIPVLEGIEHEPEEVRIGNLPIMLRSSRCNILKGNLEELQNTSYTEEEYHDELRRLQEDPLDPGGYFINNGSERVLISLEDLAPNRMMVEHTKRYGRQIPVAKVFSQRDGFRALISVEKKRDGSLMVDVPNASNQIPLIVFMRALGLKTDEEIVKAVVTHPDMMPTVLANIEDAREEHGVDSRDDAIEFLGRKLAGGQAREYRRQRAESLMDRTLLPHLGNESSHRLKKALFLGRMARSVLQLGLDEIEEDDKDHYANKRIKMAGHLMEDLFRVAFKQLAKDIKYQLERAHSRNRELKVSTAVRSDVLSQRLAHALATGNWVGGRSGVSQLLDRTANLSALSHVRRVVSPLTRSQPHFDARELHPTQWGRLCPNETPEGPNCGLVKNMALATEVSEGADEEEIRHNLYDLGVQQLEISEMTGGDN
jgi:DNA-directed RNA polymerase beta subunit